MENNLVSIESFINERKPLLNGYIRPILTADTEKYVKLLSQYDVWKEETPFAVTVFGDIISYDEEGYIIIYKLVDGTNSVICAKPDLFFTLLNDPEYQNDYFDMESYDYAKHSLGDLAEDESYIYEPIPALGGSKGKETLSKGKTYEYINMLISLM